MIETVVSVFLIGIIIFLYALFLSFWTWMMVDAAKKDKFWWLVLVLGLPGIGAAMYYFTEKKHDYAKIPGTKNSSEKKQKSLK